MAKGPEIPKTDSAEIEILIDRLKQNKLEQRDVELIERLLRTVLMLVDLLQRKNLSIKRLREMLFGRHTEKRKATSVTQPEETPEPEDETVGDPITERRPSEKSQRQGLQIFRHSITPPFIASREQLPQEFAILFARREFAAATQDQFLLDSSLEAMMRLLDVAILVSAAG